MKWAHLPVAGGIYDQHPKLIEEWQILFREQAEARQEEIEREKREAKAKKPGR